MIYDPDSIPVLARPLELYLRMVGELEGYTGRVVGLTPRFVGSVDRMSETADGNYNLPGFPFDFEAWYQHCKQLVIADLDLRPREQTMDEVRAGRRWEEEGRLELSRQWASDL